MGTLPAHCLMLFTRLPSSEADIAQLIQPDAMRSLASFRMHNRSRDRYSSFQFLLYNLQLKQNNIWLLNLRIKTKIFWLPMNLFYSEWLYRSEWCKQNVNYDLLSKNGAKSMPLPQRIFRSIFYPYSFGHRRLTTIRDSKELTSIGFGTKPEKREKKNRRTVSVDANHNSWD
jgi:hypothetical protein